MLLLLLVAVEAGLGLDGDARVGYRLMIRAGSLVINDDTGWLPLMPTALSLVVLVLAASHAHSHSHSSLTAQLLTSPVRWILRVVRVVLTAGRVRILLRRQ